MSGELHLPELIQDVTEGVRRRIAADRQRVTVDVAELLRIAEERLDDFELFALDLRALAGDKETLLRFRLQLGLDVDSYLDHRRLEIAYEIVTRSSARVVEIARSLGFPDAEIFSKWFKRRAGHSPARLREKSASPGSPSRRPLPRHSESDESLETPGMELTFHDWQRAVVEVLESGKLEELIRLGVESYPEVARQIPSLEAAVARSRRKKSPGSRSRRS